MGTGSFPFRIAVVAAVLTAVATAAATTAGARSDAFYLDLKAGQCGVWPHKGKTIAVVPCSNPTHNLEVYWVGRAGWGNAQPPAYSRALAIARALCTSAYVRKFRHAFGRGYGWYAFWPDAGAETAKYRDRLNCSLARYPGQPPLGAGRHG